MDILNAFNEFEQLALTRIQAAANADDLEAARIEFLGQKNGRIRDLQKLVGQATPDQKPRWVSVSMKCEQALRKHWIPARRPSRPESAVQLLTLM